MKNISSYIAHPARGAYVAIQKDPISAHRMERSSAELAVGNRNTLTLRLSILLFALILFSNSACPILSAEELSSYDKAENYLIDVLKKEKQYANWNCIFYMQERSQDDDFLTAVREKHDEACGGDTSLAPVVDRYKVGRNGAIYRYDPLEDEYIRFPTTKGK